MTHNFIPTFTTPTTFISTNNKAHATDDAPSKDILDRV
jgi:hypothetical protein